MKTGLSANLSSAIRIALSFLFAFQALTLAPGQKLARAAAPVPIVGFANYGGHDLVEDSTGKLHLVLVDAGLIKYAYSSNSGVAWTVVPISVPQDGKVLGPTLAADQNGNVFIFYYFSVVAGEPWSYSTNVVSNITGSWVVQTLQDNASYAGNGHDSDFGATNNGIRTIKALTDSANQVHLIGGHYGWYGYGGTLWEFVRSAGPSGTWSAKVMASHIHNGAVDAGTTYHENPIVGASDKITILTHNMSLNGNTDPNKDTVYHVDRVSGAWGSPVTIDAVSTDSWQPTALAYDGLNALHAAYQGNDGQTVYHRQDWGTREAVFAAPAGFKMWNADMMGDAAGNLRLIYDLRETATDKYGELFMREKPAGGSWGTASALTSFGAGHDVIAPHLAQKIGTPSLNSPRLVYADITSRSPSAGQLYFQDLSDPAPTPTPAITPSPSPSPSPFPSPTPSPSPSPSLSPTPSLSPSPSLTPTPAVTPTPAATPVGPSVMWIRQFGSNGNDRAYGVATDAQSNAFAVGGTNGAIVPGGSSGGTDGFVRKYDYNGVALWTRQVGAGPDTETIFQGVAVDGSGNVVAAGSTGDRYSSYDALVHKYNNSGTIQWTSRFGTGGGMKTSLNGVAADPTGNIYVTGSTNGVLPGQTPSGSLDGFIRKYNSSGTELWTRQFGNGSSSTTFPYGVALDGTGNPVVGGYQGAYPADAFVRKFDSSSGSELLARQFGSPLDDQVYGAAGPFVAGFTSGSLSEASAGGTDGFIRKLDNSLNEVWTRQFGTSSSDAVYGVASYMDENSWVAGYTGGTLGQASAGGQDAFVRKYDAGGDHAWTVQLGTNQWDAAYGVAYFEPGIILVVGSTYGAFAGQSSFGGQDAFIARILDGAGLVPTPTPSPTLTPTPTASPSPLPSLSPTPSPTPGSSPTPSPTPAPTATPTPAPGYLPGDVNADGVVDVTDLTLLAASFGKRAGDPGFSANTDVNGDGVVDIFDLVRAGLNFGRTAASPTPTPGPTPTPTPWPTPTPTPWPTPPPTLDGPTAYTAYNCALCHGANRQGGFGPPVTSAALAGQTAAQVAATITNGKNAMPSFSGVMTLDQITALAYWLKTTP